MGCQPRADPLGALTGEHTCPPAAQGYLAWSLHAQMGDPLVSGPHGEQVFLLSKSPLKYPLEREYPKERGLLVVPGLSGVCGENLEMHVIETRARNRG